MQLTETSHEACRVESIAPVTDHSSTNRDLRLLWLHDTARRTGGCEQYMVRTADLLRKRGIRSTLLYGDNTLALPIGGKRQDVSRRQLIDFGHSLGLATKPAERILDKLLSATGDLEAELRAGALPFDPHRIADTVAALRNRRRLLSR